MKSFYYRTRNWEQITPEYVEEMAERFHFNRSDWPVIDHVARDIKSCIKDQEVMEINIYEGYAEVAITLGFNLDVLLDKYSKQGRIIDQLAGENLVSDLLMKSYNQVIKRVEKESGKFAGQICFWGDETLPIEELPEVLERFSSVKIRCTEDYSLRPAKSVLFRINLVEKQCQSHKDLSLCEKCPHPCGLFG